VRIHGHPKKNNPKNENKEESGKSDEKEKMKEFEDNDDVENA
jgi:hypothetical protein